MDIHGQMREFLFPMANRNAIPGRSARICGAEVALAAAGGVCVGALVDGPVVPYAVGALLLVAMLTIGARRRQPPTQPSSRPRAVMEACEQLRIVFQPVVNLHTGEIAGYEALARFPTGRPDEWFAEAHALGLGVDLEMSAIVQSVALRHPEWGYVSINVSPATISPRPSPT